MDYSLVFYLASIIDKVSILFTGISIVLTSYLWYLVCTINDNDAIIPEYIPDVIRSESEIKKMKKHAKLVGVFASISWIILIFIPSKEDMYLIIGGEKVLNYISNDSTLNETRKEESTLILNELKTLNKENVEKQEIMLDK